MLLQSLNVYRVVFEKFGLRSLESDQLRVVQENGNRVGKM